MSEANVKTISEETEREQGIRYAAQSITGTREQQQDTLFVGENHGALFAIVCDGMGGLDSGDKASAAATETFIRSFYEEYQPGLTRIPDFLRDTAFKADMNVCGLRSTAYDSPGTGTTAVAIMIENNSLYWMSIGDSKVYIWRNGQMICPVQMHNCRTLLESQLKSGYIDQIRYDEEIARGDALTSYIGIGGIRLIEINRIPLKLEKNDVVLLCSDGLYKKLTDEQINEIISMRVAVQVRIRYLLDRVSQSPGNIDNTSIVLIET